MNRLYRLTMTVAMALAPWFAAWSAHAEEPRFALGAGVTTFSTEVQGDLDFSRRVGVEAGIGAPFGGDLAWSLGARAYLTRRHVAPYLGALYANERWGESYWYDNRHIYVVNGESHLLGPTIGVRFRQRRLPGLGGFVQLELMQEMDHPGPWIPSLGAGIQWWF